MAVEKPTREKLRPPSQQPAPTCQLCESVKVETGPPDK